MHIEQSDFHDQLVRGLAHKMNNILSLFHGYLGLLMDDKQLDRGTREGLAAIRKGAHTASELMDRTRAFTKPPSTVWRQIEPEPFLRMVMPTLESLAENGVKLELRCDAALPNLWVDVSRLRTAIIEIVRNACEASPRDGVVSIELSSESHQRSVKAGAVAAGKANRASQPIHWVVISVTDAGEGIPQENAKKIFQPFFSTKGGHNTMGLGLSVAMGLVQQMGGVIRYTSRVGRTTFRIFLPSRSE